MTTADEADRWSELARAVSLERSHRSWLGVQFAPITAGAIAGALMSLVLSAKADPSIPAWQWMTSVIVAGGAFGLLLFGAWALGNMRPLRASYYDSPLWRERAVDYSLRAEALRRAEAAADTVTVPANPQARRWRRGRPA